MFHFIFWWIWNCKIWKIELKWKLIILKKIVKKNCKKIVKITKNESKLDRNNVIQNILKKHQKNKTLSKTKCVIYFWKNETVKSSNTFIRFISHIFASISLYLFITNVVFHLFHFLIFFFSFSHFQNFLLLFEFFCCENQNIRKKMFFKSINFSFFFFKLFVQILITLLLKIVENCFKYLTIQSIKHYL